LETLHYKGTYCNALSHWQTHDGQNVRLQWVWGGVPIPLACVKKARFTLCKDRSNVCQSDFSDCQVTCKPKWITFSYIDGSDETCMANLSACRLGQLDEGSYVLLLYKIPGGYPSFLVTQFYFGWGRFGEYQKVK
jgi:hypothetical protein